MKRCQLVDFHRNEPLHFSQFLFKVGYLAAELFALQATRFSRFGSQCQFILYGLYFGAGTPRHGLTSGRSLTPIWRNHFQSRLRSGGHRSARFGRTPGARLSIGTPVCHLPAHFGDSLRLIDG